MPAWPASTRRRDGVDRAAAPALGLTLEERDGKTLLVLSERHPSKEAVDEAIGFGEGLRQTFG